MKKQLAIRAVFDGIIRALALFFAVEYTTSVYFFENASLIVGISAASALVLSVLLAGSCFKKLGDSFNCGAYAAISGLVFVLLAGALEPVNYLTVKIRLLPLRELSSSDELVLIFVCAAFFAFNIIGRLATFCTVWLKRRGFA